MNTTLSPTSRGEVHLVGHDDHRHALARELAHHVEHLLDQLRVERAGDLVEQHHVRVHRQRPRDRHPLLLAPRQPIGILVHLVREPDALEQLPAALVRLFRGTAKTDRWAIETFSITRRCGNRLNCWKTIPTRRRT